MLNCLIGIILELFKMLNWYQLDLFKMRNCLIGIN